MHKKILVVFATAVAIAAVAPSMASATGTVTPTLPGSDVQAYYADGSGTPINGTVSVAGALSLNGAATVSCSSNDFDVDYTDDGMATVTSFVVNGCSISGFPSCPVATSATGLPWGANFGHNTSTGVDRLYVNVSRDVTLGAGTPTCPNPAGVYPATGTLSPAITISGSTLIAAFGTGSGSISGPLGTTTIGGSLSGGVASGDQIVF